VCATRDSFGLGIDQQHERLVTGAGLHRPPWTCTPSGSGRWPDGRSESRRSSRHAVLLPRRGRRRRALMRRPRPPRAPPRPAARAARRAAPARGRVSCTARAARSPGRGGTPRARRLLRSCRPPARSGGRWRDRQRRWRPRRRWSTQLKRPSRGLDTTSQQPSSPCWRITRVDVLAAA
jgi:hypothetical protein